LYTSTCGLGRIFAVTPGGQITTYAGTGQSTVGGAVPIESIPALEAAIHCPYGLGIDPDGNLVVAEHSSNRIRAIWADGTIHTVVGAGEPGTSKNDGDLLGDGGPAIEATLQEPVGICFDAEGNLYFADRDNHAVRRVDRSGIITTVAGTGNIGLSGDGGLAVAADIYKPADVAVDRAGDLFFTDSGNNLIRRVDLNGIITTIAGTGEAGYEGDGGPAIDALIEADEIIFGPDGDIYFSSTDYSVVRRIDGNGIITLVAGTGTAGFSGDGLPATLAQLNGSNGLVFDAAGNLYIGDQGNNRIRMVTPDGIISTYAPR
jgi:sugar lactone lactonase YvrE